MKLWHVSNPCNRKSILKNGLVPNMGACYKTHYMEKVFGKAIFLSTDKNNIFNSTWDDDIFEVDIPDELITVYEDVSMKYPHVYVLDKIDNKYITCIYEGTGESTF